jgi:hypothetical protein
VRENQKITSAHQIIDAVNPINKEAGIMVALQCQNKHRLSDPFLKHQFVVLEYGQSELQRDTLCRKKLLCIIEDILQSTLGRQDESKQLSEMAQV